MRKILSILMALGVILGLTLAAAPVAAAPCVCPTAMGTFDIVDGLGPPDFCAGAVSDYDLGFVTPITLPITLIAGKDSLSVDFPADTDLSSVVFTGVFIDGAPLDSAASLTISGQHLEAVIPVALFGTMLLGTGHDITVNGVINPSVGDTYCLYIDYVESCAPGGCAPVQFACEEYVVAPAVKDIGCHFDFSPAYAGIAEDYIPAFLAGAAVTPFNFILRDENGGCTDPCTTPSAYWFEVTACPVGETISFTFAGGAGSPYTLTNADVVAGTKFDLMAAWTVWPPPDVLNACTIGFSSPGDYELQFFVQCPAGGCPGCGGPEVVTHCILAATAYQYMDSFKVPLEDKWNLVSLPLFPFDTSIEHVLSSMDDITQLVSVWYFGQCEDAAPDVGVWHTEAYDAATDTFAGDVDDIQTGKAYWIRTLHSGETGYAAGVNGFWVFGTHAIMPDPTGVDMGYFDVCEGWNMVGFKAPWPGGVVGPQADWLVGPPITGYLYNFNTGVMDTVHYGMIYEWAPLPVPGAWVTQTPGTATLNPGLGYWIAFDGDGEIYPDA